MIDAVRSGFHDLILSDAAGPHRAGPLMIVLVVIVALLGVVDYLTGPVLSLALLYSIPAAIAAVVAGRRAGLALALAGSVAQTIAGLLNESTSEVVVVLNGFALLATLAIIVLLIAAIRDAALASRRSALRGREFLAYAAHQLRTPLAGMRASTDALLVGGATSQQERLLMNLSREADRAGRLLAALLQMARLDQGESAPAQPLSIVDICRTELERLEPRAGSLALELRVPDNPPGPVLLSGEATRDALSNLLDNARRHAATRITLTLACSGGTLEVSVADDGPGLPEGAGERVFERFVSLDGGGGSGLGLPIARGLIEAQGGRLTYEDHRFVMRLPLRRPPAADPRRAS